MTESRVTMDKALNDELRKPSDIHVLALRVDPNQLERAEAAVDEVLRRFHENNEERYATIGISRGAWTWTRANGLIVMSVLDCDAPVLAVVEELAAGLSALGISGRLEPQPPTDVARLPDVAYTLEARLHVGEAVREGEKLGWHTDTEAYERVLRIAVDWSTDSGRRQNVAFRKSFLEPFLLDRNDDPLRRLMDEREDNPQLWTSEGEIRWVAAERIKSRVLLVTLFPLEQQNLWWRRAYAGMKQAMQDAAPELAYGYIKHGVGGPPVPGLGTSLMNWPVRPGWDPQATSGITALLQDDHKAPDAFALQVFGPGYELRELSFPSYRAEDVGQATLLEHRDLEAWFRAPFVPAKTPREELRGIPAPAVLADARFELDQVLLQEEHLASHGFHLDPDGLP